MANPDVAATGSNPLVHYIRHGEKEGRGFSWNSSLSSDGADAKHSRSDPISFSIIVHDGEASDLELTIRSIFTLSKISVEVISSKHSNYQAAERGSGRPGLDFIKFLNVDNSSGLSLIRSAVEMATNAFVIVLGPGDILTPDALWKLSEFINRNPCDVVYSDEIQRFHDRSSPATFLKPAWSPELLSSFNYFGRVTALRRSIVLDALSSETNDPSALSAEAAEWDLNLRVAERTQSIERLPEVLCLRLREKSRDLRLPDASNPDDVQVLQEYWRRRGHEAVISRGADGTFRSTWALVTTPLVSIIIPNKNRAHLLRTCTEGIYNKTSYKNIEIIIVDNGSTEPDTLDLYKELTGEICARRHL